MTMETLSLQWFRGAAEQITLETNRKSIVVYGPNGAGKSSFADALEYLSSHGKIKHLQHEHTDKHQVTAVRNTHAPEAEDTMATLSLRGNHHITVELQHAGGPKFSGEPPESLVKVQGWTIERFLLRQDEVSAFINMRKGEKYSALAPLLGFEELEFAAENLRQLRRTLGGSLKPALEREVATLQRQITEAFGDCQPDEAMDAVRKLAAEMECPFGDDIDDSLRVMSERIQEQISQSDPIARRTSRLSDLHLARFGNLLQEAEDARRLLRDLGEDTIRKELAVLEAAADWPVPDDEATIECPACGQDVSGSEFRTHVESRLKTLEAAREANDAYQQAMETMAEHVRAMLSTLEHKDLSEWLSSQTEDLLPHIGGVKEWLQDGNRSPEGFRADVQPVVELLEPRVEDELKKAPQGVNVLLERKGKLDAAQALAKVGKRTRLAVAVEAYDGFLRAAEQDVREEIQAYAQRVLESISERTREIWGMFHPRKPIEEITLFAPSDKEKAIDIRLSFYGVEQPSPRLTLSEGHRNSLGLSIFLAMVVMEEAPGRPIILDDVVSSMDHGHRANIVNVLNEVLPDRQVIILTHDRSWFAELRMRLPQGRWEFKRLLPWESPEVGARWADNPWGFEEARQMVSMDPARAGHRCRQICESEMGILCENLTVALPYKQGEANDRRTVAEFLEPLTSRAKKALRKADPTSGTDFKHAEAGDALAALEPLVKVFANRASHAEGIGPEEAEKVIDASEHALSFFECKNCEKPVWWAKNKTGYGCRCGQLIWKK